MGVLNEKRCKEGTQIYENYDFIEDYSSNNSTFLFFI
jgi:hypothetical protein